ncbi:uncharacterized protein [Physcomitrium patens]|uniref:Nuclear receptor corepressor 1 n=1 Tax=Physcomitrium patens TaxID=3218 RepID=A0A2K1JU21_PHYPA|nr:uncharacterized protein LOC112288212 isoform X2 [Physcomitrium patens]PNR45006.1 hypothetical protein PHYPA_014776 [Physcomitrium patens]|eukprot:XP_024387952.1 uncharacterized protein LOC112288212 isoform X2 [Physcomitrella patens]
MDKEVKEVSQPQVFPVREGKMEAGLHCMSPLAQRALCHEPSCDRMQLPATIHSVMAEATNDTGERISRVRSGPFSSSVQPKSANLIRTAPPIGKKVIRGRLEAWRGRFDNVWDDHDSGNSSWHGPTRDNRKSDETRREREDRELRRNDDRDRKEEREQRRSDERSERDEPRRVRSATFGSERVFSSIRGLTAMDDRERDRDRDYRQGGRSGDDSGRMIQRERSFNGAISSISDRSSVTQFGSGKDWSVGDKRSDLSRFERYGTGNRDGSRAEYEGHGRDSSFTNGWRRERSHSGVTARHSSFAFGNKNFGEHGSRGSLLLSSGHDSHYATTLSSNHDSDHPSPSKRPRLGWGQGLAKYEKKVGDTDDVSPPVEKHDTKKDAESEAHRHVEEFEENRDMLDEKRSEIVPSGGSLDASLDLHKKRPMPGVHYENKQEDKEGITDCLEKQEKSENKSILWRDGGGRERSGQDKNSCALYGDGMGIKGEDEKKAALSEELLGLEQSPAPPLLLEDCANSTREEMSDSKPALPNDTKVSEPNAQDPVSHVLVKGSQNRTEHDDVTLPVLQEHESLEGKDQSLVSSVVVGENEVRGGDLMKSSSLVEMREEVIEDRPKNVISLTESLQCSVDAKMVCLSSSQSSPTSVSTRFEKSPIHSERDAITIPALCERKETEEGLFLSRESSMTSVPEGFVVELMSEGTPPVSMDLDEDKNVKDVLELVPVEAISDSTDEVKDVKLVMELVPVEALPESIGEDKDVRSLPHELMSAGVPSIVEKAKDVRGVAPETVSANVPPEPMILDTDKGIGGMSLELMQSGVPLESMIVDNDEVIGGELSGSMAQSLGSEEPDYYKNQFGSEVVPRRSLRLECDLSMIDSFLMENKEKARLAGASFVHLLPLSLTGDIQQQLYHSPTEAPVWQRNIETHKNIQDRLLRKLAERHHFCKFKERVLTLRFRALKEAWKREQKGLFERKNRPKAVDRRDIERRSNHGPPSQRSSLRLRPFSLSRLDVESEAAEAMKKLMKDPHVEAFCPVLKMPAMILDEKERASRRFVSRNALVEDPVAVEMERKILNPWTTEEKKIFAEKFALHRKSFKEIASNLKYKTTADCIEYYYRNHKSEDFDKSKKGVHSKDRGDHTKTSSTFLTPTSAGIKRNHEANCARLEAINVVNMNTKLSQINSPVLEHAKPTTLSNGPLPVPAGADIPRLNLKESEVPEVVLPSGATAEIATVETATSSLMSTPCSVSSTPAPVTDQWNGRSSVKERVGRGLSTTRCFLSERHPAGPKGTRSTHLRRLSSRAAAQEDSQWTDEERELFTSAVATYGKDFRLIASHVGSKNLSQCKAFFSKTRKRLGLDELVEQFEANEAAAMLMQSFRHEADLVQEAKLISSAEDMQMDSSAGVLAHSVEELSDTAAAVSTLESLKVQSKCLTNDMSDLSLVADAAAVMEEITLEKSECTAQDLFSNEKSLTQSEELAHELLKVDPSNCTVLPARIRQEEENDSEATKSDDSYQVGAETESDIVVDQAAAALLGMSEMSADAPGLKKSKSEAKICTKSSPVSVFSRSQSARLPTSSPPSHSVMEVNLSLTSERNSRQLKERVNPTVSCKPTTRERPQDMLDAHTGRKSREVVGGEPKPRREPTSWTQEEKEKFAVILQEHGKDWALLHESLPSKSLTQIKTYFQNSKARSRLPASDKLLNVARSDVGNRKRKADEFDSTRKAAELALPLKQKVRGNVAPPEFDNSNHKEDSLLGSSSVSGTAGVGVDILPYAARFGSFPSQPVGQDTLNINGMHSVRQMPTSNYSQGTTQDGHQVFRPGERPSLPNPVATRSHHGDVVLQQFSDPGLSMTGDPDLQGLSQGVVPQAGPPAAIHQVAQQVQQMLAQQQHLQKQLALLLQQQAALPQALLPQHQQATQQTLQAVRPLEKKLHQVVQQLQHQQALAQNQEMGIHNHMHFQQQQLPQGRGILKVKPIRGAISKPLSDLAGSPSQGVFQNQCNSRNQDIQLHQQGHSLLLGIGTNPAVTAGSTAGLLKNHAKTLDVQDSDTDSDCEGMGSMQMVADDSHQRMSVVHSTSSGQQQGAAQSTTSTLSSDSEQVKSWDVKLFGQSLLSKPPSLPSSVPRTAGSSMQEFVKPSTSSPATSVTFPTGTLSKGFRSSESLPSAFGRVGASSSVADGQLVPWAGMTNLSGKLSQYGAWSTTNSLQVSGVTEAAGKEPDSVSTQEAATSVASQSDRQHTDAQVLVSAPEQGLQGNDEHRDSESGLSAGQSETPVCGTAVAESPFLDGSQNRSIEHVSSPDADQCRIGLEPTSHINSLPTISAGPGQWG